MSKLYEEVQGIFNDSLDDYEKRFNPLINVAFGWVISVMLDKAGKGLNELIIGGKELVEAVERDQAADRLVLLILCRRLIREGFYAEVEYDGDDEITLYIRWPVVDRGGLEVYRDRLSLRVRPLGISPDVGQLRGFTADDINLESNQ